MFEQLGVFYDNLIENWTSPSLKIYFNVFILVIKGKVHYHVEGRDILLEEGDLCFIPINSIREARNDPKMPHKKYTILFRLSPPFSTWFKDVPLTYMRIRNYEYVKERFQTAYSEFHEEQPCYLDRLYAVLLELRALIIREQRLGSIPPNKTLMVNRLLDYIMQHYKQRLNIEELSAIIDRTPTYMIAMFKEVTGFTPIEYCNKLKISEAKNLIMNSSMSIKDIALYLGFENIPYFTRLFKKYTAMTPKEYRLSKQLLP